MLAQTAGHSQPDGSLVYHSPVYQIYRDADCLSVIHSQHGRVLDSTNTALAVSPALSYAAFEQLWEEAQIYPELDWQPPPSLYPISVAAALVEAEQDENLQIEPAPKFQEEVAPETSEFLQYPHPIATVIVEEPHPDFSVEDVLDDPVVEEVRDDSEQVYSSTLITIQPELEIEREAVRSSALEVEPSVDTRIRTSVLAEEAGRVEQLEIAVDSPVPINQNESVSQSEGVDSIPLVEYVPVLMPDEEEPTVIPGFSPVVQQSSFQASANINAFTVVDYDRRIGDYVSRPEANLQTSSSNDRLTDCPRIPVQSIDAATAQVVQAAQAVVGQFGESTPYGATVSGEHYRIEQTGANLSIVAHDRGEILNITDEFIAARLQPIDLKQFGEVYSQLKADGAIPLTPSASASVVHLEPGRLSED